MAELDRRAVLTEFEGVRLGDARLDRRMHRVLGQLSVAPCDSFPEQMKSEADQEGLYRFLNNANVSFEILLGGHQSKTLTRMPSSGLVRIVHDTTEFTFEGEREGLGGLATRRTTRQQPEACRNRETEGRPSSFCKRSAAGQPRDL